MVKGFTTLQPLIFFLATFVHNFTEAAPNKPCFLVGPTPLSGTVIVDPQVKCDLSAPPVLSSIPDVYTSIRTTTTVVRFSDISFTREPNSSPMAYALKRFAPLTQASFLTILQAYNALYSATSFGIRSLSETDPAKKGLLAAIKGPQLFLSLQVGILLKRPQDDLKQTFELVAQNCLRCTQIDLENLENYGKSFGLL